MNSNAETNQEKYVNEDVVDVEATWTKNKPAEHDDLPQFEASQLSQDDIDAVNSCTNAYDYFKLFQTEEHVKNILYPSQLYAQSFTLIDIGQL